MPVVVKSQRCRTRQFRCERKLSCANHASMHEPHDRHRATSHLKRLDTLTRRRDRWSGPSLRLPARRDDRAAKRKDGTTLRWSRVGRDAPQGLSVMVETRITEFPTFESRMDFRRHGRKRYEGEGHRGTPRANAKGGVGQSLPEPPNAKTVPARLAKGGTAWPWAAARVAQAGIGCVQPDGPLPGGRRSDTGPAGTKSAVWGRDTGDLNSVQPGRKFALELPADRAWREHRHGLP